MARSRKVNFVGIESAKSDYTKFDVVPVRANRNIVTEKALCGLGEKTISFNYAYT